MSDIDYDSRTPYGRNHVTQTDINYEPAPGERVAYVASLITERESLITERDRITDRIMQIEAEIESGWRGETMPVGMLGGRTAPKLLPVGEDIAERYPTPVHAPAPVPITPVVDERRAFTNGETSTPAMPPPAPDGAWIMRTDAAAILKCSAAWVAILAERGHLRSRRGPRPGGKSDALFYLYDPVSVQHFKTYGAPGIGRQRGGKSKRTTANSDEDDHGPETFEVTFDKRGAQSWAPAPAEPAKLATLATLDAPSSVVRIPVVGTAAAAASPPAPTPVKQRSVKPVEMLTELPPLGKLLTKAQELALAKELEGIEIEAWRKALGLGITLEVLLIDPESKERPDLSTAERARHTDPSRRWIEGATRLLCASNRFDGNKAATESLGMLLRLNRGALQIREVFTRANQGLVHTSARRFTWSRMDYLDLVQAGNLGLLHAMGVFDYRKGNRFSTYAMWWIRHHIARIVQNESSVVRVPVHLQEAASKVARVSRTLRNELGRDPTHKEIAAAAEITIRVVDRVRSGVHLHSATSFDLEIADGITLGDTLPCDQDLADNTLAKEQIEAMLRNILDSGVLTGREELVIRARFGLGMEEVTLREIGERNDIELSRERIRQLEKSAIQKLRLAVRRAHIRI